MKLHIDTDIGGDPDDLCALAMALNWPGAEIVGITTVSEHGGKRAGYVRHALQLAGRADIPVAAGADVARERYRSFPALPDEPRYWKAIIPPCVTAADAALDLIERSITQGAVIVGIGPYTNLARLERRTPGILQQARLFLMGGWIQPTPAGYPDYSRDEDYNVQCDVDSALFVIQNGDPTFVPLAVTVQTALRREDLPVLRTGGRLAQLIAHQAEQYAQDEAYESQYGVLLLHHDPLACAIALGWNQAVQISTLPISTEIRSGLIYQEEIPSGKPARIVTQVDGEAFNRTWLNIVRTTP